MDYDKEADVLYISFDRSQEATDCEMLEDGVILRYRREELVGPTILDVYKRERGLNLNDFHRRQEDSRCIQRAGA